jgi:hypothetical protein
MALFIKVFEIDIIKILYKWNKLQIDTYFRFYSHIKLQVRERNVCKSGVSRYHIHSMLISGANFLECCSLSLSRSVFSA